MKHDDTSISSTISAKKARHVNPRNVLEVTVEVDRKVNAHCYA